MSIDRVIDALMRENFEVHEANGYNVLEILADQEEIDSIVSIIESAGADVGDVEFEEPAYWFVEVIA